MAEHKICARCGRPLRSARARRTGYGSSCRRSVYRGMRVLAESGNKQAWDAAMLLYNAEMRPVKKGRVWSVWGRTENYLTSKETCNCKRAVFVPLANSCYHSVAVAVLAVQGGSMKKIISMVVLSLAVAMSTSTCGGNQNQWTDQVHVANSA